MHLYPRHIQLLLTHKDTDYPYFTIESLEKGDKIPVKNPYLITRD